MNKKMILQTLLSLFVSIVSSLLGWNTEETLFDEVCSSCRMLLISVFIEEYCDTTTTTTTVPSVVVVVSFIVTLFFVFLFLPYEH